MPNLIPHVIDPALEVAINEKFGERPIVSRSLEGREPKDQFTPYNTSLIRAVAEYLNQGKEADQQVSPVQLEHLVDRYSGGLFRRGAKTAEGVLTEFESAADVPGIGGLAVRKDFAKSIDDFYKERESLSKAYQSARFNDPENVDPDLAYRFRVFNAYGDLMKQFRKQLDGVVGRDERFKVERRMVGIARLALGLPPLDRYPVWPEDVE